MATIAVVFGTTTGQAAKVARHVAHELRTCGHLVRLIDTREPPATAPLEGVSAVIVAASVRMGKFQRPLVAFVRAHRDEIDRLPNVFLAVSLSASRNTPAAQREVRKTIARFVEETALRPAIVRPVAGALLYTRYPFFTKLALLFISRLAGGDTDTSRDYEYTDFEALTRFTHEFASSIAYRRLLEKAAI
jgi:menaquinone-dependent protoporphyrinogen oxidase